MLCYAMPMTLQSELNLGERRPVPTDQKSFTACLVSRRPSYRTFRISLLGLDSDLSKPLGELVRRRQPGSHCPEVTHRRLPLYASFLFLFVHCAFPAYFLLVCPYFFGLSHHGFTTENHTAG